MLGTTKLVLKLVMVGYQRLVGGALSFSSLCLIEKLWNILTLHKTIVPRNHRKR